MDHDRLFKELLTTFFVEFTDLFLPDDRTGKLEGRREMVLRQLRRRLGLIPEEMNERISRLPDLKVDELGEALLDFKHLSDVQLWLTEHE